MPRPATGVEIRQDLFDLVEEWLPSDVTLVADILMPPFRTNVPAAKYPVLPREAKMKIPTTERAPDGSFTRGDWKWSKNEYTTDEFGYEIPIDNVSQMIYEDYINQEQVSSESAKLGVIMAREGRVIDKFLDTTVWTGADKLHTITDEVDDQTNCDIFGEIETAAKKVRAKCGLSKKAMTLVMTDDQLSWAIRTAKLTAKVQYVTAIATMTTEAQRIFLTQFLGIKNIVIIDSLYDSSALDLDAVITRTWSNEYMWLGVLCTSGQNIRTRGIGRQFVWTRFAGDFRMETYGEPKTDATVIRCREYRGATIMDTDYGILIDNAVTTVNATTGF